LTLFSSTVSLTHVHKEHKPTSVFNPFLERIMTILSNKETQLSSAFVKSTAKVGQLHKSGTGLAKLHDHYINADLTVDIAEDSTTITDDSYSFTIPTLNLVDFSIMTILKDRVVTGKGDSWDLICSNLAGGHLDALQAKYQRDLVSGTKEEEEIVVGVNLTSSQYQANVIKMHRFDQVILVELLTTLVSFNLTGDLADDTKILTGLQKVARSLTSDLWNEKSLETYDYLVKKEQAEKERLEKFKVVIDLAKSLHITDIVVSTVSKDGVQYFTGTMLLSDWTSPDNKVKEYFNIVGSKLALENNTLELTFVELPI
jgi:hypothetical protein